MDVAVAVLARQLLAVLAGLVVVAAVLDELGTERAHRGELDRVRPLGDADARLEAEEARRVGDRLAVVARRGGDQAAAPLLLAQLRDEVDAAANLEGADRLVVLVLDPDLGADELAQRGVAVERRRAQMRRDATPRLEHVGKCRPIHRCARR